MPRFLPFRGLRPASEFAAAVAAPPYDVLSSAEARTRAAGNPHSFLHVSKAEIDLPPDTQPYAAAVYDKARENFARMCRHGLLTRDAGAGFYLYRMSMGAHRQTGVMGLAGVADYESGRIKRHEFTRPDKEDDRVRHMEALNAQTGPVLLAYRADPTLDDLIEGECAAPATMDVTTDLGVRHQLWLVQAPTQCAQLSNAFDRLPAFYIADGHHRAAAAARLAVARRSTEASGAAQFFLAAAFPHTQMRILEYNRVVADLNGMEVEGLVRRLEADFAVTPASTAVAPAARGEFGLYAGGRWFRLRVRAECVPSDPVGALDVSVLSERVLGPLLGIRDLRRDQRIDFVGGIRGLEALQARVDAGHGAAAFSLYPTGMEDLMAVADSGQVMPPKSTWFEPKLADGLVSHLLD